MRYNNTSARITGQTGQTLATVADRSKLKHLPVSDWLASVDRSKPIKLQHMPIFATVRFGFNESDRSEN